MTTDYIRYDILAQNALRGVVRTVMSDAAKKGLRGEHHFKISFDTNAPGVRLSPRLHEMYPQEMTIVLQHQFWDLEVGDEAFEVGLSFSGIPERLRVPFEAITGFFDPSVEFGLQFATVMEEEDADSAEGENDLAPTARPAGRKSPARSATGPRAVPPLPAKDKSPPAKAREADDSDEPNGDDKPTGGAEVVRLDRFRKK